MARSDEWILRKLGKVQRGEMPLEHLILELKGVCWICHKNQTLPGIDVCATCFDKG